jgi:hypothetical protein
MNEELQKKLVEIINGAQKVGKEAFIFTKEQVPDVIQQLLMWKFAQSLTVIIFSLIVFEFGRRVFFWASRAITKEKYGGEEYHFLGGFFAVVVMGASIVVIFSSTQNALQIWIAPKVYLLEYAAQLISK